MTTPTDICNRANALIGSRSTIVSLDEDSEEARVASMYYDIARQEMLRAVEWNFAKARAPLTLLGSYDLGTSILPWAFKYAYPSDCLRLRYIAANPYYQNSYAPYGEGVVNNTSYYNLEDYKTPFEEAADKDQWGNDIKVVNANVQFAQAVYTRDISNVALFDAQFTMALTHKLAAYMTISISGAQGLRDEQEKLARDAWMMAAVTDGNEGRAVQDVPCDWIRARTTSGSDYYDNSGYYNGYPPSYKL